MPGRSPPSGKELAVREMDPHSFGTYQRYRLNQSIGSGSQLLSLRILTVQMNRLLRHNLRSPSYQKDEPPPRALCAGRFDVKCNNSDTDCINPRSRRK